MSIRGALVKYIIIEKLETEYDDYNQPVESWEPAANLDEVTDANGGVYAEQHFKGGDEGDRDGQLLAWQKVVWKVPGMESLNASKYRIVFEDMKFDIENIWQHDRANMMIKTTQKDNQ